MTKFQLGNVRLLQKRFEEALEIYKEARDAFNILGEPRSVAGSCHQIGRVHQDAGQPEAAEQAYRQSLAIRVRENDRAGQADTLNQMGNLFDSIGHLEEAAAFYRQAADVYVRFADLAKEGIARSNLADTLIKLRRYEEARQEILRTIECDRPYGHASEPWKTWSILANLERATGHAEAAQAARQQAIEAYLAYLRAGGYSHQHNQAQLFALVAQAIRENNTAEARQVLDRLGAQPDAPPWLKVLTARLQAVLAGDRNSELAGDPELSYIAAAELQFLLESLSPD